MWTCLCDQVGFFVFSWLWCNIVDFMKCKLMLNFIEYSNFNNMILLAYICMKDSDLPTGIFPWTIIALRTWKLNIVTCTFGHIVWGTFGLCYLDMFFFIKEKIKSVFFKYVIFYMFLFFLKIHIKIWIFYVLIGYVFFICFICIFSLIKRIKIWIFDVHCLVGIVSSFVLVLCLYLMSIV